MYSHTHTHTHRERERERERELLITGRSLYYYHQVIFIQNMASFHFDGARHQLTFVGPSWSGRQRRRLRQSWSVEVDADARSRSNNAIDGEWRLRRTHVHGKFTAHIDDGSNAGRSETSRKLSVMIVILQGYNFLIHGCSYNPEDFNTDVKQSRSAVLHHDKDRRRCCIRISSLIIR